MSHSHHYRWAYLALISLLLLGLSGNVVEIASAQKPAHKKSAKTVVKKYNLCGTVTEKRGNQMPTVDQPRSAGQPVVREVAAFPMVTTEQVVSDETGFITDLKGFKPVQTVKSGQDGKFCFNQLPAGRYSVLVREPQGWYSNQFDTQNHINPVTVQIGKTTTMTIEITHQAAF